MQAIHLDKAKRSNSYNTNVSIFLCIYMYFLDSISRTFHRKQMGRKADNRQCGTRCQIKCWSDFLIHHPFNHTVPVSGIAEGCTSNNQVWNNSHGVRKSQGERPYSHWFMKQMYLHPPFLWHFGLCVLFLFKFHTISSIQPKSPILNYQYETFKF